MRRNVRKVLRPPWLRSFQLHPSRLNNSIANLGGFVGPVAYGWLKDTTGSIYAGLAFVSFTMLFAGVLVVRLRFVKEAEATVRGAALAKMDSTA